MRLMTCFSDTSWHLSWGARQGVGRTTRTRKSVFQQLKLTKLHQSTMGSRQPHGLARMYAFGRINTHRLMICEIVSTMRTTVVLYRLSDHCLRSLHKAQDLCQHIHGPSIYLSFPAEPPCEREASTYAHMASTAT